jgi:3-methyladenine DNA glycosylase AlkD
MSAALVYGHRQKGKMAPELWPALACWSSRVENWAHSDDLSSLYSRLLEQRPAEVYAQLQAWNASNEQWLRRLSLVSLIREAKKQSPLVPLDRVLPLVSTCVDDTRYYVQKAVGWVLRELSNVHPDEIGAFFEVHKGDLSGVAFSVATEHWPVEERQRLLTWRKAYRQSNLLAEPSQ